MATTASLLTLPYQVRRKIYAFAGLVRPCPVTTTSEPRFIEPSLETIQPGNRIASEYHWHACRFQRIYGSGPGHQWNVSRRWAALGSVRPDCYCLMLPRQLLLVCRMVYNEAHHIMYSENSFALRACKPDDLEVLTTLPGSAFQSMQQLLIRLNCWPCPRGHEYTDLETLECKSCYLPLETEQLSFETGTEAFEETLRLWTQICAVMAQHIHPGRLNMTFICDVSDAETAQAVLAPMQCLPRLKSLTIRLARRHDAEIKALARNAVSRATAYSETGKIEAQYQNENSFFPFLSLPREIRLHVLSYTRLRQSSNLKIIDGQLAPLLDASASNKCCGLCTFTKKDCCCELMYAASSSLCKCSVVPYEMLLVCRTMYMDAAEVLYSSNTFDFHGDLDEVLPVFKKMRPATLQLIRSIALSPSQDLENTYPRWSEQMHAWIPLFTFMRNHFKISRLHVCINMTPSSMDYRSYNESALFGTYVGIARAVKQFMSGLQDFHMWLWVYVDLEKVLEKVVMGLDYDSRKGNRHAKPADGRFTNGSQYISSWYNPGYYHRQLLKEAWPGPDAL